MAALRAPKLTIFNVLVNIIFIKRGTTLIFGMVLDYQRKIHLGLFDMYRKSKWLPLGAPNFTFSTFWSISSSFIMGSS